MKSGIKLGDPIYKCSLQMSGSQGLATGFTYHFEKVGNVTKLTKLYVYLDGFVQRISLRALHPAVANARGNISLGISYSRFTLSQEQAERECRRALTEIRERMRGNLQREQQLYNAALNPVAGLESGVHAEN